MKRIPRLAHQLASTVRKLPPKPLMAVWARVVFPLISAAALAWFLIRVLPKPIRATYPCQRAAFPLASAFIVWLLGVKTGLVAWMKWGARAQPVRQALMALAILCVCALGGAAADQAARHLRGLLPKQPSWSPSDPPNSPMGTARGLFPGRVVWMRDTNASRWNGTTGHWWDDNTGINPVAVERMMSCSLLALAGATNESQAWDNLFRYYNTTHGRGNAGYATNETIALKINCNNAYGGYGDVDNQANASPQSVLAMLRQLVNRAGVPQNRIVVYESVRVIPDCIYNPGHAEFPNVVWMDSQGDGANGRQAIVWHDSAFNFSGSNAGMFGSLPEAVYQATYLVNMSIFKGHWHAGVTLTAKNHFGSIKLNSPDHYNVDSYLRGMDTYHPFVDLVGTKYLGGKTLLFMIDGLYGVREVTDFVSAETGAWNNLFNGEWSASYFMSLDPLAIDSVGLDFLRSEFGDTLGSGHNANADNFLHEAAQAGNPPSQTDYRPDGTRLTSLGVHEHWNNATAKQYSRNLGGTNGIELVKLEASAIPAVALVTPQSGAVIAEGSSMVLEAVVAAGSQPTRKVDFLANGTLLGTVTNSPYALAWLIPLSGQWALTAVATDASSTAVTSAVVSVIITPSPEPPVITRIALTNNGLALTFRTAAGRSYRVDYTESLNPTAWSALGPQQTASSGSITVVDTPLTVNQRYYRAVRLP